MEMQTGWKIEPCYRPVDSVLESNQVATSETQNHTASAQVNQNEAIPNDRPQAAMRTMIHLKTLAMPRPQSLASQVQLHLRQLRTPLIDSTWRP